MEPTQNVKITDQELTELNRIRNLYTEAQYAFGQLYISRRQLDMQEQTMNDAYRKLQEDEQKLLDTIVEKYGEGNLDPKTGIFTKKVA
jgi:hypothetical protein